MIFATFPYCTTTNIALQPSFTRTLSTVTKLLLRKRDVKYDLDLFTVTTIRSSAL